MRVICLNFPWFFFAKAYRGGGIPIPPADEGYFFAPPLNESMAVGPP